MCGKVSDVDSRKIAEAVENTRFKRFRRESFSLYVYGICSSCQAKMTRERNRKSKEKVANKKNKHNKK
jgi:Fur family ferric uptake transcriptional regulator